MDAVGFSLVANLVKKVRATVMEMTDEEALIAQGVENNARQDPSFIERALFVAGIIRELGKNRRNAQERSKRSRIGHFRSMNRSSRG